MKTLTQEQIDFLNKVVNRHRGSDSPLPPDGAWEQTDKGIIVRTYVDMSFMKLKKIPVKFYMVCGYFNCQGNELTSLQNCPRYIGYKDPETPIHTDPIYFDQHFFCGASNKLVSLKGGPKYVLGYYDVNDNPLKSAKGYPKMIKNKKVSSLALQYLE